MWWPFARFMDSEYSPANKAWFLLPIRLEYFVLLNNFYFLFLSKKIKNGFENHGRILICSCVNTQSNHCHTGPAIVFNKWFGVLNIRFHNDDLISAMTWGFQISEYVFLNNKS